jgi:serine/threonine-protein kinase
VFAVGVVLWETLAGRKLFEAQSSVEAMYRVLEAEIPSLNSMDGIPETVVRAVARALKRDPRERFQTALEFACELEASSLLPTRMVGEWVRQCCAAELAEREEQLRAVEAAELDGFTQEPNSGPYEVVSAGSFPAGSDDPTELEANLALGRPSEPSVLPRHASAKRAERALPAGRRIVVFFSLFVAVIVIGLVSQRWPTRGAGESAPASLVSAESPTSLEPAVSAPADRDAREAPSVDPFDPHAARSSATPESTRPQTHAAPETRAPTSKPAGAKTNPERPAARKPSRKSAGVTERRPEDLFSRQ